MSQIQAVLNLGSPEHLAQSKKGAMLAVTLALLLGACLQGSIPAEAAGITCPAATGSPDKYINGNGIDVSGFCTSIYTGAAATAAMDLDETQNKSLLKQMDQYAKQIEEVQQLTIQTETLLNDLEENPLQVIVPNADQLIANQKRIDQLATDIAKNSSSVGANLMKDMAHPSSIGLGDGSKFALWSEARRAAVEESYTRVSQFIKDASSKNMTITEAIYNINHAQGRTATAKATANVAGQQLSWLQNIAETLNQLMGAQAVENGAKLQSDIDGEQARQDMVAHPPFSTFKLPPDDYKGPGTSNSQPF